MTTKEAIQAMLDGKKVRNKKWSSYIYMYFDGDILLDYNGVKFNNLSVSFTDDWEIYEEPKPKQTVTIEKWLLNMKGTKQYAIEEGSKEEMETWGKNKIDAWQKVKLLETYEVEL